MKATSNLGPIDLKWLLAEQKSSFCTELRSREIELAKLAVAMNFPEYFVHYPDSSIQSFEASEGLLHVAVAAPHLNTGIRDADYLDMIRVLVGIGCDINERNRWMLRHINTNRAIYKNHGVSPLAQTLIDQDCSEELRLSIVKTLLDLGANPDSNISNISYYQMDNFLIHSLKSLQYCVFYESAAFVRLLLQHGAAPTSPSMDVRDLLRFARIRQDAAIIQTLVDFGVGHASEKDTFNDPTSVEEAILIPSHIAAAPSGGISTALFRDPYNDARWGVLYKERRAGLWH